MTYDGYLAFGGNEVVNTPRAYGIARTAPCSIGWLKGPVCETLQVALGDQAYTWANIDSAPWYDPDEVDLTSRFFGVYGVAITGLHDSTRTVAAVEGVDDGGVIGRTRRTMRQFRVRVTISAQGRAALDYGLAWLDAVLTAGACGQHGNLCGVADMTFLTDCPPPWDSSTTTEEEYQAIVNGMRRTLHGVAVAAGPTVTQEWESSGGEWGAEVEFTVLAEKPWLWGESEALTLNPSLPVTVQDIPYNLVPYPSAELAAAGDVLLATNYSTNPSVEINATGWNAGAAASSGSAPAAYFTSGRVTELAAVGAASWRGRLLGNGSTAASGVAILSLSQNVTLGALTTGTRVSFTMWAALLKLAGTAGTVLTSMEVRIQWRNGVTNLGSSIGLGTATVPEFAGRVFAGKSLVPPATADNVTIAVNAVVSWVSSATAIDNSDIRLYADALAVTVP